jgi:uncharacterized membrane protein
MGVLMEVVVGLLVGFLAAAYGLGVRPAPLVALKLAGTAVASGVVLLHLLDFVAPGIVAILATIVGMWVATTTIVMRETDLHLEAAQIATGTICVPILLTWLIADSLRIALAAA